MANNSLLVKAFSSMANFNSTQEKEELSKEIKHYNLDSWKNLNRTKTLIEQKPVVLDLQLGF